MTYLRLANLAYLKALEYWCVWKDRCEMKPDNQIYEYHERKAWEELKEIEEIVLKLQKEINKNG